MPIAFVLINTEPANEEKVLQEVTKIEGIEEAYILYGVYDILAKIQTESMENLKQTIIWQIRKIEGVVSTLTLIVAEEGS
ncbi:Lrp/AsnC family transcriptional regulator [candidate division KSB1 bacterium]|nr:Lrp/AsnC ligand binding domain-containing protein [Candidatus Sigynarchaeota archaeon]RKY81477.1 MAG: Lrp/AsnC family transcriptional regulator [candidate division KSB1 bacterium]